MSIVSIYISHRHTDICKHTIKRHATNINGPAWPFSPSDHHPTQEPCASAGTRLHVVVGHGEVFLRLGRWLGACRNSGKAEIMGDDEMGSIWEICGKSVGNIWAGWVWGGALHFSVLSMSNVTSNCLSIWEIHGKYMEIYGEYDMDMGKI